MWRIVFTVSELRPIFFDFYYDYGILVFKWYLIRHFKRCCILIWCEKWLSLIILYSLQSILNQYLRGTPVDVLRTADKVKTVFIFNKLNDLYLIFSY